MRTKTLTVEQLAAISTQRAIAKGWAKYECSLDPGDLPPLEAQGYNDASGNYEVWREAAIREFDQRK